MTVMRNGLLCIVIVLSLLSPVHSDSGYGLSNIFTLDTKETVTGVDADELEAQVPGAFLLHQNYPNPFNPSTAIRFALPRATSAQLIVFNLQGREIRRLIDEFLPGGSHTIHWDATNHQGQPVSSGVYLYRLQAGGYGETRKMILLR